MDDINTENEPKETLYINNLTDKINQEELMINLYHLFIQYGDVYEIKLRKGLKFKGQAFVTMKNTAQTSLAKRFLNNYYFFSKPIKINFAKNNSNIVNNKIGIFKNNYSAAKNKIKQNKIEFEKLLQEKFNKKNKETQNNSDTKEFNNNNDNEEIKNNVIFIKNLNIEVTKQILEDIYSKFEGFVSARYMENYAIVEFDNKTNAELALNETNNKKITQNCRIQVVFANK